MRRWPRIFCLIFLGGGMELMSAPRNPPAEPNHPWLLVANQGDHTLSLIDPDAGRELAKVPTKEVRAHEVTASADGRLAYLPIYGDSGVGLAGTDGTNDRDRGSR